MQKQMKMQMYTSAHLYTRKDNYSAMLPCSTNFE